jgi:hypothetical protein
MTGGIHGCQTITLISNRGVWMAHYWERYSNGNPEKDTPATEGFFLDRVIKHITGVPVTVPAPYRYQGKDAKNKPYLDPQGGAPTIDLFNRDDDETKLFISTPIADGQSIKNPNAKLLYAARVDAIKTAFRRRIGKRPEVTVRRYDRLNYRIEAEKALENKSHRGMHLFQYDPNSDGQNLRAWRLFSEQVYEIKSIGT